MGCPRLLFLISSSVFSEKWGARGAFAPASPNAINSDKNQCAKTIVNMHTESSKEAKKSIWLQRHSMAERHALDFIAI